MHLSYKFGEIATYDSDVNLYYKDSKYKAYYFKEQSKVEFYYQNDLYQTINDVKRIDSIGGGLFLVLTNSNILYAVLPNSSTNFQLTGVVDYAIVKTLYDNNPDADFTPLSFVVAFENKIGLYNYATGNNEMASVPLSFEYGEMCSLGFYGSNTFFLATKDKLYCMDTEDLTMRYLTCSLQYVFPNWVDAGFMRYSPAESEYTAFRMVLFFGGGDLQNCIAVDLKKLANTFKNLSNGDNFEFECEDQYNNGVITPLTEKRVSNRFSGIDFCDGTNKYIKTTISLLDPPRISSVIDSNGLEIANISELAIATSPITEITFAGKSNGACYIKFQQSGVLNSTFIRYNDTLPDFESVEIAGTKINVGETKSGFNITGDFAIKINSIVSSPTLQGNFTSKDKITTPFTNIKFIDKNGSETEVTDF